jgi:isopenicillin N synthase-like dioxygenase
VFSAPLSKLLVAPQRSLLNDQLVEELYGEIRNFFALPLETKHSYKTQVLVGNEVMFLGTEHAKGKRAT